MPLCTTNLDCYGVMSIKEILARKWFNDEGTCNPIGIVIDSVANSVDIEAGTTMALTALDGDMDVTVFGIFDLEATASVIIETTGVTGAIDLIAASTAEDSITITAAGGMDVTVNNGDLDVSVTGSGNFNFYKARSHIINWADTDGDDLEICVKNIPGTEPNDANLILCSDNNISIEPVGDLEISVSGNLTIDSKGDIDIGSSGNFKLETDENFILDVDNNLTTNVGGDVNETVTGDKTTEICGNWVIDVKGEFNLGVSGPISIETEDSFNIGVSGDFVIDVCGPDGGGDIIIDACGSIDIGASGEVNINSNTAINIGCSPLVQTNICSLDVGDITVDDITVLGDLVVNGTTTTINSTEVTIDDNNLKLNDIDNPTCANADGGGITICADDLPENPSIIFNCDEGDCVHNSWTFNQDVNIGVTNWYTIDKQKVLGREFLYLRTDLNDSSGATGGLYLNKQDDCTDTDGDWRIRVNSSGKVVIQYYADSGDCIGWRTKSRISAGPSV